MHVVTDSQASIDIVQNCGSVHSLKDVLRPEYDVASELYRLRERLNVYHEIIKVRSHIDVEEASDECHWMINDMADRLATEARAKALDGKLRLTMPILFPGAKAGCFYRNWMITGSTSLAVQTALYKDQMVTYLMQKYRWSSQEHNSIDWDAQSSVLLSIPDMLRITMMKYVHGWLATKQHRYRNGCFLNPTCFLCDQEEGNTHIFCCKNLRFTEYRRGEMGAMLTRLSSITTPEVLQIIRVGLDSLSGGCTVQDYQDKFVTDRNLRFLVQEQTAIGWDQALHYGNLETNWYMARTDSPQH